jgi:LysM repeat protein
LDWFLSLSLGALLLAGCAGLTFPLNPAVTETPEATALIAQLNGTIMPYHTSTPSRTLPPPTAELEIVFTPTPSATPFIHAIAEGETLLGIAIRYGVTLEALRAANPEVDPRLLSIGQVIVIPIQTVQIEQPEASPTSVPVRLLTPRCYPLGDGSLSCLVEIQNDQDYAVESIQVWLGLFDPNGELQRSQTSIPALNLLQGGGRTAVIFTFSPPVPLEYTAQAELLAAFPANDVENRYVETTFQGVQVERSPSKLQARIFAQITASGPVLWIWTAAVAYDEAGQIIGVRKWKGQPDCQIPATTPSEEESSTEELVMATPQPCGPFALEMDLFSLGPEMVRVELIGEAGR